jgi:hypothetical protein
MVDPKSESTAVPISTAVMQPDAQPHASQQAVTLNDIRVGHKGGRGVPITQIYAVQSDEYAICQAGEVSVHFANQIKKPPAFIGQIAYALQLALDGDGDGAKATVATAKTLVLAGRAARGRFRLAAIAVSDEN